MRMQGSMGILDIMVPGHTCTVHHRSAHDQGAAWTQALLVANQHESHLSAVLTLRAIVSARVLLQVWRKQVVQTLTASTALQHKHGQLVMDLGTVSQRCSQQKHTSHEFKL